MTWRKWLVRGLVFSVLGGTLAGWGAYEAWTNPVAMRRQVLDKLQSRFIGAAIRLESARLRLLGGIGIQELRMARRDALDTTDFLYVPAGVIYHDKEHLLDGTLALRKIELQRPHLRLIRQRDGSLNLKDLMGPINLSERMPTLIVHQGTLVIEDHTLSPVAPLMEITGVELTAINDPSRTIVVEGNGQTDVAGPVQVHATVQRDSGAATATLELPAIPVRPALIERIASFCPGTAAHLRQLQAAGKMTVQLAYQPGAVRPLSYDLTAQLSNGQWAHAAAPLPLEKIEASLQCIDGRITRAQAQARAGGTRVRATLEDCDLLKAKTIPWEERIGKLSVAIDHLPVTLAMLRQLPDPIPGIEQDYQPRGPVSVAYAFTRSYPGVWNKHWSIHPEGMTGQFIHFPYRLSQINGAIEIDFPSSHDNRVVVDLVGRSGEVPVSVRGTIAGEKKGCGVDMTITGNNVPLDEKLFQALPTKSREVARAFLPEASRQMGLALRPMGLGDIKVWIRRPRGERAFQNRYRINFHDAAVRYDLFPYPLEDVSGTLDILPDHWECRHGHGTHKGGTIDIEARSYPLELPPGTPEGDTGARRDLIKVGIRGRSILLDPEFEQALAPPTIPARAALQTTWKTLALHGRLSFGAEVIDHPDHPQDIDVGVDVHNCTMRPGFFPYAMSDVSASVRYARGRVLVTSLRARHGPTELTLARGLIDLKPTGGFRAWFWNLLGLQLTPDADFLQALPPGLRKAIRPLNISTPVEVHADRLVFDSSPETGLPLKVWWEGSAVFRNGSFQAGLPVTGVDGEVSCRGHFNGQQLEGVNGYVMLDRATILNQPLQKVQTRIELLGDTPDTLRFHDFHAGFFGGTLGGQARVKVGSPLQYEVKLELLGARLEQVGKHNLGSDADLQGTMHAALHLFGEGDDVNGLHGNGRVEVPEGKMYRLPLLLDLLKALGLRMPDRTAFERARMVFAIEGPRMRVQQLNLYGNAISLRGEGMVNLNGSNIQLDFNVDWGHAAEVPGLSDLSQAISSQILKIKMRGKIGAVRFEKELMPGVVEPIKKAFGAAP